MNWVIALIVLAVLARGTLALAVKPGVELSTRPEMEVVRRAVERVWSAFGFRPTITSGMESESVHRTQIHYQGLAEDYRTKDIFPVSLKPTMFAQLRAILGSDYDVIFEDEGTPNEHLHVEYDPR